MWQASDALVSHTQYSQLDDGRWRATYRGFVTVFAEGESPCGSQMEMEKLFDSTLADLIRRTSRTQSKSAASRQVRTALLVKQAGNAEPKTGAEEMPSTSGPAGRASRGTRRSPARGKR